MVEIVLTVGTVALVFVSILALAYRVAYKELQEENTHWREEAKYWQDETIKERKYADRFYKSASVFKDLAERHIYGPRDDKKKILN